MRLLPLLLGASQAASCPSYCQTCHSGHADCSNSGLSELNADDFDSDLTSIDLSGNQFESVPRQLRRMESLEEINLSGNPIKYIDAFEFESKYYSNLKSLQFADCDNMDYVAEAAFFALNKLDNVSFHNSALFYISGAAFYECNQLKSVDLSHTELNYIEASLDVYLANEGRAVNLDETLIECDCTNAWMMETSYIQGVNCPAAQLSKSCPPKVIRDNYVFDFERGLSAKAMCFIAGAEEVTTGDKRSRHSINFHSVDENDEGTYDCIGVASDKSEVSVSFSIQTHKSSENEVSNDDEMEDERDYSDNSSVEDLDAEDVEDEDGNEEATADASSSDESSDVSSSTDEEATDETENEMNESMENNDLFDDDKQWSSNSGSDGEGSSSSYDDFESSSESEESGDEEIDIDTGSLIGDDALAQLQSLFLFIACLFAL